MYIYLTFVTPILTSEYSILGRTNILWDYKVYPVNVTQVTRDATNKTEVHFRTSFHLVSQASLALSSDDKVILSLAPPESYRVTTVSYSEELVTCCGVSGGRTFSGWCVCAVSWVGGNSSACATPPKKSVMRVLSSGRRKRSERTPACERITVGS